MSKYSYFSDYDNGEGEELSLVVWNGIKSVYERFLNKNYFAESFSGMDCGKVTETDERMLIDLLKAHNPHVISSSKIFKTKTIEIDDGEFGSDSREYIEFSPVMDFIQFLYKHLSEPIQHKNNTYINFHYTFNSDRVIAQEKFREEINIIFQRNNINVQLNEDGKITRILSPFFEKLSLIDFAKNDTVLNEHLNIAYKKFQSTDMLERKIALKELWDAFEKITGSKSSRTIPELIRKVITKDNEKDKFISNETNKIEEIYKILFDDAKKESDKLKQEGNTQSIRHSNEQQNPLDNSDYVDYLFYRMSATIHLLLTGLNK